MDKIRHIAIIPDGNRRWAKRQGMNPSEGHIQGVKTFRKIADAVFRKEIPYLTFWAASEDNLRKRNYLEVKLLVSLIYQELTSKELLKKCQRNEIRIRVLGNWHKILKNNKLLKAVSTIERKTLAFEKHNLTLLFGYDGRKEMIEAIKRIKKIN